MFHSVYDLHHIRATRLWGLRERVGDDTGEAHRLLIAEMRRHDLQRDGRVGESLGRVCVARQSSSRTCLCDAHRA